MNGGNQNVGNYFLVLIGVVLLTLSLVKIFSGITSGFEFHIWDLELRGLDALFYTTLYIIVCASLIIVGFRGIKRNGKHRKP